jgi:hypothetical protein
LRRILRQQLIFDLRRHLVRRFKRQGIAFERFVGADAESAEAPFALLVVLDGLKQMNAAEVRPQPVRHKDLRVRNLPQQKIRDAIFAAGADHQIGVRHVRRIQILRDLRLVDALVERVDLQHILKRTAAHMRFIDQRLHQRACSVHHLRPRAVIQRQRQRGAGVLGRLLRRPLHRLLNF